MSTIICILIVALLIEEILRRAPAASEIRGTTNISPTPGQPTQADFAKYNTERHAAHVAFRQRVHEERERDDARRAVKYKRECAMRAWHAGYGPHP